jgi:hypothetical protein
LKVFIGVRPEDVVFGDYAPFRFARRYFFPSGAVFQKDAYRG